MTIEIKPVGVIHSPFNKPDGTPLLDIKPYVPVFDSFPASRSGWLTEQQTGRTIADGRFHGAVGPDDGA